MILITLYKIDSRDGIRVWECEVYDRGSYSEIIISHGTKDGKLQEKVTKISKGKNIGKANETCHYEQAILEATSKWKKQVDKGYSVIPQKVFLPMLAQDYSKHKKKISFPCYVQPKLDGARCTISKETDGVIARSRKGKEWKVINHITDSLILFFNDNPNIVLDGELYSEELTFQNILSAIKRDEKNDLTEKIKFFCYDCYDQDNPELVFEKRIKVIKGVEHIEVIRVVETLEVEQPEDVDDHHDRYVSNNYEGAILRNKHGLYKVNGRSYDLQKVKRFDDAEFKIVGMKLDKNDECVFECEIPGGKFEVKPDGSHEERVDYYNEENIGKMLTVKHFGWTTSDVPEPRFPIGKSIRENDE